MSNEYKENQHNVKLVLRTNEQEGKMSIYQKKKRIKWKDKWRTQNRKGVNAPKCIFKNTTLWCSQRRNNSGLEMCEKKFSA